jgi:hypothetical protein
MWTDICEAWSGPWLKPIFFGAVVASILALLLIALRPQEPTPPIPAESQRVSEATQAPTPPPAKRRRATAGPNCVADTRRPMSHQVPLAPADASSNSSPTKSNSSPKPLTSPKNNQTHEVSPKNLPREASPKNTLREGSPRNPPHEASPKRSGADVTSQSPSPRAFLRGLFPDMDQKPSSPKVTSPSRQANMNSAPVEQQPDQPLPPPPPKPEQKPPSPSKPLSHTEMDDDQPLLVAQTGEDDTAPNPRPRKLQRKSPRHHK